MILKRWKAELYYFLLRGQKDTRGHTGGGPAAGDSTLQLQGQTVGGTRVGYRG